MEMEEACIVSNCLTMQASSFAGRLFLLHAAPWFAYKTEFIGFAGRRTQTVPAPGPPFLIFRPGGLRTVTDFIGFAGRRTQTVPAPGPHVSSARPGAAISTPGGWLP